MKILFYDWDHLGGKKSGGVGVYQCNLINYLLQNKDYDIYYLNSGLTYDNKNKTYIKQIDNIFEDKVKSFEIINSPIIAPTKQDPKNLYKYLNDEIIYNLIYDFIKTNGDFDVIHFNNLEGLSLKVLELKEKFPNTKFIYSAHNYYSICSQVNLWQTQRKIENNCKKCDYEACANCYKYKKYDFTIAKRKNNSFFNNLVYKLDGHFCLKKYDKKLFEDFHNYNVKFINKYIDQILAVSDKVRKILLKNGFSKEKTIVSYIGTKVADSQKGNLNYEVSNQEFNIMYMGYARKDKGFDFFMDALDSMNEEYAKKTNIKIIAKSDKNELYRIKKLISANKFKSVFFNNGYTKDNQNEFMEKVNLGIVPVQWEDNLPQIAMEQIAFGIPILVSDLGGVQELCNNDSFVFKHDSIDDFLQKLYYIYDNPKTLHSFFKHSKKLVTFDEHVKELEQIYSKK